MNIKEIKEMINLMNENNLTELEIEKEGLRVRLKKGALGEISVGDFKPVGIPSLVPVSDSVTYQTMESKKDSVAAKSAPGKSAVEVKSPMVGTFYRAPSPESPAFVEINQIIEVGQVVCIIEAMKLMNEIKSDVKGKIVDVLVDNSEPVEFGQPLFLIEPA